MTFAIEFLTSKPVTASLLVVCFYLGIRSGYFSDFRPYLKSLSLRSYLFLCAVMAGLFFLVQIFDPWILNTVQVTNHPVALAADYLGEHLSKNTIVWITFALLYLLCYFTQGKRSSEVFYGALLAMGFTGLVSQIFKFTFVRARPYSGSGNFSFFNWHRIHEDGFQSLPSGDVAIIAGASFLVFFSVRNLYLKILILFLPLATAFYRVAENKHWPSDTFISIGIGMMVGWFVWSYKKKQV